MCQPTPEKNIPFISTTPICRDTKALKLLNLCRVAFRFAVSARCVKKTSRMRKSWTSIKKNAAAKRSLFVFWFVRYVIISFTSKLPQINTFCWSCLCCTWKDWPSVFAERRPTSPEKWTLQVPQSCCCCHLFLSIHVLPMTLCGWLDSKKKKKRTRSPSTQTQAQDLVTHSTCSFLTGRTHWTSTWSVAEHDIRCVALFLTARNGKLALLWKCQSLPEIFIEWLIVIAVRLWGMYTDIQERSGLDSASGWSLHRKVDVQVRRKSAKSLEKLTTRLNFVNSLLNFVNSLAHSL